jgi:two-component system, sensor histidine kinase and response regulator
MRRSPMMQTSRASILLVEDDSYICDMLTDVLEGAGYRVKRVHDGLEAIRAVDKGLRDSDPLRIVLLDMRLPVVDGVGVLNHLTAHGDKVPVVAISASPQWLAVAESAGVQAVLGKPFAMSDLLTIVDRVLNQSGAAA